MPVERLAQEFEKAEKPFELYKMKAEGIMKTLATPQEQIQQIQILNTAFSKFLETTKRPEIVKEASGMRMEMANTYINAGKQLEREMIEKAIIHDYNTHLLNAEVDITSLTKTISDTSRMMKKFGSDLKHLASDPVAFREYIEENRSMLLEQYNTCISETEIAFAKAADAKEITKAVGATVVSIEVALLLGPLLGTSMMGSGLVGGGEVVIEGVLKGENIKDIPTSHIALGITIGAISPSVAKKVGHYIEKVAKNINEAELPVAVARAFFRNIAKVRSEAGAIAKTVEKYTHKGLEVTKKSIEIFTGEGHDASRGKTQEVYE